MPEPRRLPTDAELAELRRDFAMPADVPTPLSLEDLERRQHEVAALNERSPSSMGVELFKAYGDAIHYAQDAESLLDGARAVLADRIDRALIDRWRAVREHGGQLAEHEWLILDLTDLLTPTTEPETL